ncbi:MAG: tryptophan synthase subunit alpha [Planctomycetota bacterium]|nr:tryptophan synthase subunit alpha [Planctomycetota bacterium]
MSRIRETFERLKSQNATAFMPYISAGDPDLDATKLLVRRLAVSGVDLIEVGFPYSDPIADGPVIQTSFTHALERGIRVPDIFRAFRELKEHHDIPPLLAMVSYSIVFRIGPAGFVRQCVDAGFSGLIVPDLPGDEADEFVDVVREAGLDLIQLVAPTTPLARIKKIVKAASGFVYCIAVAGITGERTGLPDHLRGYLDTLRGETDLPLAVGFGIGNAEQAAQLREFADGVIVGSAVVRRINAIHDENLPVEDAIESIGQFTSEMVRATHD